MLGTHERVILEIGDAVQAIRDAKWRNRANWDGVEKLSGVKAHTIHQWNHKNGPQLKKFLLVLDALGLEMVIRRKQCQEAEAEDDEDLEKKVRAGLEACSVGMVCGDECPYEWMHFDAGGENCIAALAKDTLALIEQLKKGEEEK